MARAPKRPISNSELAPLAAPALQPLSLMIVTGVLKVAPRVLARVAIDAQGRSYEARAYLSHPRQTQLRAASLLPLRPSKLAAASAGPLTRPDWSIILQHFRSSESSAASLASGEREDSSHANLQDYLQDRRLRAVLPD